MTMHDDEPLLRRSLRLEADERGPRIDVGAIAAAHAAGAADAPVVRAAVIGVFASALAAIAIGAVLTTAAPPLAAWGFDRALDAAIAGIALAERVPAILSALAPSFLATAVAAVVFVQIAQHREGSHATAPRA